ncbi:MAG: hypothetical protein NTZ40_04325 [Cyanobacteria bacterium]|nr:hypothetical protein [Cyanobacteriota bacterium]
MKCIQCNADSDLKDRIANHGRCKYCKYPFAFEPTTMDAKVRFTDGFFAKALADISANGTLYFTRKQLLYLLEKRLLRKARVIPAGCVGFMLIPALFTGSVILCSSGFWWVLPIYLILSNLGIAFLVQWFERRFLRPKKINKRILITDAMLDIWLQQWQRINGTTARLLQPPSAPASLAPAAAADLTEYSFDRVLVCDSVAIAQLLIANNIHFEHNCAVLSISGYPQAIFDTTMAMLRRNPDLQVIALHDCSPSGVALINKLRTSPDWYLDSSQVIFDLGMLPRQIATARGQAYIQVSADSAQDALAMPPEVSKQLTATELQWLEAGYFVDLESFTPKKLMQIVSYGITRLQNLGEDVDNNLILVGDGGGSGGSFIYASDNFG